MPLPVPSHSLNGDIWSICIYEKKLCYHSKIETGLGQIFETGDPDPNFYGGKKEEDKINPWISTVTRVVMREIHLVL